MKIICETQFLGQNLALERHLNRLCPMKKQQRKRTHLDHSEVEVDDLGNQNCPARLSAHIPGSARSLDNISEEPDEEVVEFQVARNVPSAHKGGESINEVGTAIVEKEEISGCKIIGNASTIQDKDGDNKNGDNNASETNGEVDSSLVIKNVAPIRDENGDTRNGLNRASGKNGKFDGHQVTRNLHPIADTKGKSGSDVNIASGSYNLQIRYPPDSDQCNPEETTQVLRRDILDNQYLSCEENDRKFGVLANKNFLDKRKFQCQCSSKLDARNHPAKLNPAQAFVHSSKPMSSHGAKRHRATSGESITEDTEYLRRDLKSRDDYSRKSGVTGDPRLSENKRSENLHSQGVDTVTFWLIMGALFMTFLTAVLVVILWEHFSTVLLYRKPCFNSSKIPIMPDIVFPKTW